MVLVFIFSPVENPSNLLVLNTGYLRATARTY